MLKYTHAVPNNCYKKEKKDDIFIVNYIIISTIAYIQKLFKGKQLTNKALKIIIKIKERNIVKKKEVKIGPSKI